MVSFQLNAYMSSIIKPLQDEAITVEPALKTGFTLYSLKPHSFVKIILALPGTVTCISSSYAPAEQCGLDPYLFRFMGPPAVAVDISTVYCDSFIGASLVQNTLP